MTAPIPQPKHLNYSLREQHVFEPLAARTQGYYDSYYPSCLREWNKLGPSLRLIGSLSKFKAELIKSLRPPKRSVFKISDIVGVRLLTRLQLGFSHLRENKFRHNFQIALDVYAVTVMKRLSISSYVANILLTLALLCLIKCLTSQKADIKVLAEHRLVEILLYGDNNCNENC